MQIEASRFIPPRTPGLLDDLSEAERKEIIKDTLDQIRNLDIDLSRDKNNHALLEKLLQALENSPNPESQEISAKFREAFKNTINTDREKGLQLIIGGGTKEETATQMSIIKEIVATRVETNNKLSLEDENNSWNKNIANLINKEFKDSIIDVKDKSLNITEEGKLLQQMIKHINYLLEMDDSILERKKEADRHNHSSDEERALIDKKNMDDYRFKEISENLINIEEDTGMFPLLEENYKELLKKYAAVIRFGLKKLGLNINLHKEIKSDREKLFFKQTLKSTNDFITRLTLGESITEYASQKTLVKRPIIPPNIISHNFRKAANMN